MDKSVQNKTKAKVKISIKLAFEKMQEKLRCTRVSE